ncbi:hypothetical protein [Larkinella terrae]|uniref:Uncharacterized protein n=1 Tax=Larkinella terrae TaxID=2025311 RepID=A0A7K0EJ45_9BACT|nr:hypothetical protein [Larkinella terrae]MRS61814.1 hypothetical protein [Larkinella terrae]
MDSNLFLTFLHFSDEILRIFEIVLYGTLQLGIGLLGVMTYVVLKTTKRLNVPIKILMVFIIVLSALIFVWGLFSSRVVMIMMPLYVALFCLAVFYWIQKKRKSGVLEVSPRTWKFASIAAALISVTTILAGLKAYFIDDPNTLHWVVQSQKRQEKSIREVKEDTRQVKETNGQMAMALAVSLSNQNSMRSSLNTVQSALEIANRKNEELERKLAATNRTVNRSAATINTVQRNQEATQEKVEAVVAKVDTVKAVVSAVILPDTARTDSARTIEPADTPKPAERKKGGLFRVFRRRD